MFVQNVRRRAACMARAVALAGVISSPGAFAATLVVNGTADASPPATSDGVCSLREAMQAIINAADFGDCVNGGGAYGTTDTVNFNIAGSGVHTINAAATLPTITKTMLIDGYSQPSASPNTLAVGDDAQLRIEINGGAMGVLPLFQLSASTGSIIQGLVLDNFGGHIIEIGVPFPSNWNKIAGNFLGTDPTGSTFVNGTNTVILVQGADNQIGTQFPQDRNVIAGHGGANAGTIHIEGGGNNENLIQGNYIGVNAAGTAAIPPGGSIAAIEVVGAPSTGIGGVIPDVRNVIVASGIAIHLDGGANNSQVTGNFIGTNAAGTAALGSAIGVQVSGGTSGIVIGAPFPGEPEEISSPAA